MLDLSGLSRLSEGVFIIRPHKLITQKRPSVRKYRFFAEKEDIIIKFDSLNDFSKWIGSSHKRVVQAFHQGKLIKGWYIDEYV